MVKSWLEFALGLIEKLWADAVKGDWEFWLLQLMKSSHRAPWETLLLSVINYPCPVFELTCIKQNRTWVAPSHIWSADVLLYLICTVFYFFKKLY